MINACKHLGGKLEMYKTLGRYKGGGDDNTKRDLK
jgi:hypothetical protein